MNRRLIETNLMVVMLLGLAAAPLRAQDTPLLTEALAEAAATPLPAPESQTAAPARAFEYSDAYRMRAKIHKVASFATIPLFVSEGIVGQSLYNNSTDGKRTAHRALAVGIGGLFGVNTVTGLWNLVEGRKDPNASKLRWVHGLMMLGADGGFLASAVTAPRRQRGFGFVQNSSSTHRAIAFTSIGVAGASYLIMLFGNH